MTTQTVEMRAWRMPAWPLLVVLLAGLALMAITLSDHAVERHGADALLVRQCMNDRPPIETWFHPSTGRQASICQIDDGRFGIQIEEAGREVTSFVKEKLRHIDQVRRYLVNRGYQQ